MKFKNSMKSAFQILIVGFVLSSIQVHIGVLGEIQDYASVGCYLLGLFLLQKEHRLFRLCFFLQIYLVVTFIFSKAILYVTPIEIPSFLIWISFIVKFIQNLLIIYTWHQFSPKLNLYFTMGLECVWVGFIMAFQGESVGMGLGFILFSLLCMIMYQFYKSIDDIQDNQTKVMFHKKSVMLMLVMCIGWAGIAGVSTLYMWPYMSYRYVGEMEPFTTDAKEIDAIQLSNGWQGHIYEYNENENLYVFHYQGKLSQKYSMIDVDFTHNNSLSREFYISHVTFGNGKQRYDYRDRYQDNMLFLGYSQPIYRVYLNPDDENIDITVQFIRQYHEDDTLKEFVFNLTYYEYGKVYSEGSGHLQQTIFRSQNEKWDTQEI